jgi:hypothetical protein
VKSDGAIEYLANHIEIGAFANELAIDLYKHNYNIDEFMHNPMRTIRLMSKNKHVSGGSSNYRLYLLEFSKKHPDLIRKFFKEIYVRYNAIKAAKRKSLLPKPITSLKGMNLD